MNFTPMPRDYEPEASQADMVLVAADHQLDEVNRIVQDLARVGVTAVIKTQTEVDETNEELDSVLNLTEYPQAALERFTVDVKATRKLIKKQRMQQMQRNAFKGKKR